MKVNKELMDKARHERKQVADLTVAEFRVLMQECFDADRAELRRINNEEFAESQRRGFGWDIDQLKQRNSL